MEHSLESRPTKPHARARVRLIRLALVVFSLGTALATAETVLRFRARSAAPVRRVESPGFTAYDSLLGWSPAPGVRVRHRTPEYDVTVRINAQGFRSDRDVPNEPPPGTTRIMGLGDFFAFGQGVELEESYLALLDGMLPGAETLNLGVPGYGVDQQLLMLESRGLRFRPDIVLLGLHTPDIFRNVNDRHGTYAKPRFRLRAGRRLELTNVPVPRVPGPPSTRNPPGSSKLFGTIAGRLETHGFGEVWDLSDAIFQRLAEVSSAAGARLLVLLLPPQYAITGTPLERRSQAHTLGLIRDLLREKGIETLDLTPVLAAHGGKAPGVPLFYPRDGHFTPAGHRVVADEVRELLGGHEHRLGS